MELLSPKHIQDTSRAEEARSVFRVQGLQELEKDMRIKLAKAELDFNATLAKNMKEWEEKYEKHITLENRLNEEIKELEKRKSDLFEGLNEQEELLEQKLDDVAIREADILKREQLVWTREQGLKAQGLSIIEQSQKLSEKIKTELS